jgi:hypothetical protein
LASIRLHRNPDGLACKRIGAPPLFGRLWEETGC